MQCNTGESSILQRAVAELAAPPAPLADLPWRHNIALIEKLSSREERLWYAREALQNAWSRDVLVHHIKNNLYRHQGQAQTNFALTLPAPQAKLAQDTFKDEYALDFLRPEITQEKDIEQGIIENAQRFLMELGKGFAFIGRQHRVEAGGKEHVFDLLLYNTFLHCYVVVELKNVPFQPEHVSKLSAYLSAADERLRRDGDQASIGVILCRSKNRIIVEYALRDQRRPIGVASYRLTRELPGRLKKVLPMPRALEHGLGGSFDV
jgi:predicted nuclease of restriction endonuclease-like (RecB) superfamily